MEIWSNSFLFTGIFELLPIFQIQIYGEKIRQEFRKVINLFEELEMAGETVSVTIISMFAIRLQLDTLTPKHVPDDAPDMSQMMSQTCPRHVLDDAPDMPQMMPQTCPR